LPKKFSDKEKEEIIAGFKNGKTIIDLSEIFKCSKVTISRHLKNNISDCDYKDINKKNNNNKKIELELNFSRKSKSNNLLEEITIEDQSKVENQFSNDLFMEIEPFNYEIDSMSQKDLSSIPISDVDFPNIVYMIVDKKIELEIKYLYEYPEWQFLSQEDLNRKTIQIHDDLKVAKRFCNKEQKVIKVPNTDVFKIAASQLLEKGISRIVNADKLISI